MNPSERILDIVKSLTPLKERVPEFKRPDSILRMETRYQRGEAAYDWIVNKWIPAQEDRATLMELFVLLNFNIRLFITALMGIDRFDEEIQKMKAENQATR